MRMILLQQEFVNVTQVDKEEEPVILKFVPTVRTVRKGGKKVKIELDTAKLLKVSTLAEKHEVTPRRLLQSIEYEVEPYEHEVITTQWNSGEKEQLPEELVAAANELTLPPQLIRHALRREQYFSRHEEYRDYPTMRAARN